MMNLWYNGPDTCSLKPPQVILLYTAVGTQLTLLWLFEQTSGVTWRHRGRKRSIHVQASSPKQLLQNVISCIFPSSTYRVYRLEIYRQYIQTGYGWEGVGGGGCWVVLETIFCRSFTFCTRSDSEHPARLPRSGVLSCVGDHILQKFYTLYLTRFRTSKIARLPQDNTEEGGGPKVHIYPEYQSVSPLVRIRTHPPPLPQARVPPPPPPNQRGGGYTLACTWGSLNSDDRRKSLALCLLCGRGPQTHKHLPQSPFQITFFRWRNFALLSISLIFLRLTVSSSLWCQGCTEVYCWKGSSDFPRSLCFMWFWFGLEILRLVYKKAFFKILIGFYLIWAFNFQKTSTVLHKSWKNISSKLGVQGIKRSGILRWFQKCVELLRQEVLQNFPSP